MVSPVTGNVRKMSRCVTEQELRGHGVWHMRAQVVDVAVGRGEIEPAVVVGVEKGSSEAQEKPARSGEAERDTVIYELSRPEVPVKRV